MLTRVMPGRVSTRSRRTDQSDHWLNRTARRLIHSRLFGIANGHITVRDCLGAASFGDPRAAVQAHVDVASLDFYGRLAAGGSIGAGESFADADWSTNDLAALLRIVLANDSLLDGLDGTLTTTARRLLNKLQHATRRNTRAGSRRNIAAHYDLSNDFFRLWLDERMMYSSAVFDEPGASLETASERKLERVGDLLDLSPGDHVLEIGTGWGGLAEYLASRHDVRVTTATISPAQCEAARARIAAAGLADRVDVRLADFRELEGAYDRIVSIEMVEAVGDALVDRYFASVESMLKPGGRFVIQAITIRDQQYARALREVDFIKKHIFPGSFIPSTARLVKAAERTKGLRLIALHDIGLDYSDTLRHWSARFAAAAPALRGLGFDDRFQRLWQFYFHYCEAGFREERISDVQMVFDAPQRPLTDRPRRHGRADDAQTPTQP